MSLETNRFYDFGDFRLDFAEKALLRDGKFIPVTPKVFETLCALVENAGRTIEKDELMRRIWQERFVEESNLTFNIKMLRRALGDDAQNPRYVETVPRRGYRFIAAVREVFPAAPELPPVVEQQHVKFAVRPPRKSYLSLGILAASIFCLLLVGALLARHQFSAAAAPASVLSAPFHAEKFASSGKIYQAAISPDGRLVAFVDETGGKQGVWLRKLDTSENTQIVPPGDDSYIGLTFAHDGQTVYFVRRPPGGTKDALRATAVYRVSIFGGVPVKLVRFVEGWISVSPDDKEISFVRCEYKDDDYCSLMIADADGGSERKILTRPSPIRISDNQFSPDGKSIAFASGNSDNGANEFRLSKIDLATRAEIELSPHRFFNIKSLKWLPDGENLLAAAMQPPDGKSRIWQISVATGEARPVTKDAANYNTISLSQDAGRIVAKQVGNNFQLYYWANGATKVLTPARWVAFAPDGKIIYSTEEGDIWTIKPDGSEQRQLTNTPATDFFPRPSPDGQFIYFTSNRTGAHQVWRMNADGSNQIQVTSTEGGYPLSASSDGKWIYYQSSRSKTLWKAFADGTGEMPLSAKKLLHPTVSPDGNLVAFLSQDENKQSAIAVMTTEGEKIIKTLEFPDANLRPVRLIWSSDNQTLNYVARDESKDSLWSQSINEPRPRFVTDLGDKQIEQFDIAPGGSFAYTRGEWLFDAILIDGLK